MIRNDEEHEAALKALETLMEAEDPQGMIALAEEITAYERRRWPIPPVTDEVAAEFRRDQERADA